MSFIFTRLWPMPSKIKGMTIEDANGDYNIYINESLSEEMKEETLRHEMNHIKLDHFRSDKTAKECEAEV